MARRGRRVLARRRRELEGLVRRGAGADFDPMAAADAALGVSNVDQLDGARSAEDDARRLRGISLRGRSPRRGDPGDEAGRGRVGAVVGALVAARPPPISLAQQR